MNVENKIRKNTDGLSGNSGGINRSVTNGQNNMDRGRNNNPGTGMNNRNGSGGRSERRDDRGGERASGPGNRQFNRTDRPDRMGQNRPTTTNGNAAGPTYTNSRR